MKKLSLMPVILILILLITGCSTKSSNESIAGREKGRYMEANISLPEKAGNAVSMQLAKVNGMPGLYVYSVTDEKCVITRYLFKEDGSWIEDTPTWLNTIELSPNLLWLNKIFEDGTGKQYLYSLELDGEQIKGLLLCSRDGVSYEKITPEGWDVKNEEYGFYNYPQLVNALSDGTLAALFYDGELALYDKDSFKKQKSITGINCVETILSVYDKSVIIGQSNNNYTLTGIDVYSTDNTQRLASYSLSTTINSYSYLDINEAGDIMVCNADGVHILEQGTSLWQTIIDGTLNSLSSKTKNISGFISASDLNYYVLYYSDQGYQLMKYYFDETVNAIPSYELTIYTLKDNSTLRQTASEFQESHPDVKVSFQVAMSERDYATATDAIKADYIKSLNTELLAGKGSDILVLDDLPVASLIEKGILSDMSDIIVPLLDKGELYDKIIQNYFRNSRIYSVPVRFMLPLILSREANTAGIDSFEGLATYIKQYPNQKLFGLSTYADFISSYSPFLSARILNEDGSINRENLITVLTLLKDISAAYELTGSYPEGTFRADGDWELASKVKLATTTCKGFLDSMFPLGIVTYVKGSFAPFEQSVIPSCEIGINTNSDKIELCKEFVALALSKSIGTNDFYDGFSINKEALLLSAATDRSDFMAMSEIKNEDGSSSEIIFGTLTDEQTQNLVYACSNANKIAYTDKQIVSAINELAIDLLTDKKSIEEVADLIINKTKLYLSE